MSDARLRLLTLNTWGRTGPWDRRKALIADNIRELDPHVVGLQEIWDDAAGNSAREIADAIGGEWHVHSSPAFEFEEGKHENRNAVLSRFPLLDTDAWMLPEPVGDLRRNLTHAMIATPWGTLPVFVTHLSWMFHHSAARLVQVQQIRAWMNERAPIQPPADGPSELLPPVVMGDFNSEPESDEIRFMRGLYADPYGFYTADCFALCGDGKGHTWDRENAYAAREHFPDRRIDYIFVRGPDRWGRGEPLVARVALTQPRDGVWASDHYAVYAEIRATSVERPPL
jgi:endonuclease/exonuclease/phosphatase family metal-dependent hydrolase